MTLTIFHNPRCSKSRQTLALLEDHGVTPNIVLYLENPPDAATLNNVLGKLGLSPRQVMRVKEAPYKELGLADVHDDAALVAAMVANPILIERPIVVSNKGAAIGRPPESVLAIL